MISIKATSYLKVPPSSQTRMVSTTTKTNTIRRSISIRIAGLKTSLARATILRMAHHRHVTYGFGAGRCVCPGQHLGENSLVRTWLFDLFMNLSLLSLSNSSLILSLPTKFTYLMYIPSYNTGPEYGKNCLGIQYRWSSQSRY
jgi:hypothetical protein